VPSQDSSTDANGRLRSRERKLRRDAEANREHLLATAVTVILRESQNVPMATIAAHAGVGVGTLYRHYATREALLAALATRAYQLVLSTAHDIAELDEPGIVSIDRFLERTIEHRDQLVLPMHGGPTSLDPDTVALRAEISKVLDNIIQRGHRDGSIRVDANSTDVIIVGAMLARPLAAVGNWDQIARRHKELFLDGISTSGESRLSQPALNRADLEVGFAEQSATTITEHEPASKPSGPAGD
jgi:AcrR family transcriptional regulator